LLGHNLSNHKLMCFCRVLPLSLFRCMSDTIFRTIHDIIVPFVFKAKGVVVPLLQDFGAVDRAIVVDVLIAQAYIAQVVFILVYIV